MKKKSQQLKESELSKEEVSAEKGLVESPKSHKGFQLNKEPGVSNEQGVPAEQGARLLKRTRGPS